MRQLCSVQAYFVGAALTGTLMWGDTVFARAKPDNSMELLSYQGRSLPEGFRGDLGIRMRHRAQPAL